MLKVSLFCSIVQQVHRVAPVEGDRYSLVFLLRARPDAVLDCAALNSRFVVPNEVSTPQLMSPETVAQFMKGKRI